MRYFNLILVTIFCLTWTTFAGAQTTQPAATSPTPEQRMDRLLTSPPAAGQPLPPKTGGPATDTTTGKAAVAPNAPALPVVREGTHLVNRSGRLNHSADGQQAIFTFDSDGKTMNDPPMIIVPNLKLQAMEGAVVSKSSDVHFRVSGTVTEYKGRNYILLEKAVVMADVEQQF
jgi:hypothetical protein